MHALSIYLSFFSWKREVGLRKEKKEGMKVETCTQAGSRNSPEREREFRAIFKRIDRTWLDHPTKDKDQVDRDDMSIFSKCWVGIRTLALREGRLC